MFSSSIFNAAIGITFGYVLLSLLISIISAQLIAGIMELQAKTLEIAINTLLDNPKLVEQFYASPLIQGLSLRTSSGELRWPTLSRQKNQLN